MKRIFSAVLLTILLLTSGSLANARTSMKDSTNLVHYKLAGDTYIIRLDKGQEIMSSLKKFCSDYKIQTASIQGIGVAENLNIGFFNTISKQYEVKNIKNPVEVTSLLGNVTTKDNEPYIHLHINVGDSFHSVSGGHLLSGESAAAMEIFLRVINTKLNRIPDRELGLNIFDIN